MKRPTASKELIDKLNAVINSLKYDFSKFETYSFIEWIATLRERPIRVLEWHFEGANFGAWVPKKHVDCIFCEPNLAVEHTTQILLHELGHILLGHRPVQMDETLALIVSEKNALSASEDKAILSGLFRSINYSDEQEIEAETFAHLIQSKVSQANDLNAIGHESQNPALRKILRSFKLDE